MLLVTDRDLLARFRTGEAGALRAVYLHYRPRVAQWLRGGFSFQSGGQWMRFRGFAGEFELEQAVHETLARAFLPSARAAYDGVRPFEDYLFVIARNHVLNQLRQKDPAIPVGGEEALDPPEGTAGLAAPSELAEPTLEEREVERLLARFLEEAEARERRLFQLRFREEQGQEEVARALGVTRIQLRRMEYKLKRRLLAFLKKHGYLTSVRRDVLGAGLRSVLA